MILIFFFSHLSNEYSNLLILSFPWHFCLFEFSSGTSITHNKTTYIFHLCSRLTVLLFYVNSVTNTGEQLTLVLLSGTMPIFYKMVKVNNLKHCQFNCLGLIFVTYLFTFFMTIYASKIFFLAIIDLCHMMNILNGLIVKSVLLQTRS